MHHYIHDHILLASPSPFPPDPLFPGSAGSCSLTTATMLQHFLTSKFVVTAVAVARGLTTSRGTHTPPPVDPLIPPPPFPFQYHSLSTTNGIEIKKIKTLNRIAKFCHESPRLTLPISQRGANALQLRVASPLLVLLQTTTTRLPPRSQVML